MAKTSLERSHSKVSNAKLTFVCFMLALFVGMFFAGLGLMPLNLIEHTLALALVILGVVGVIFFLTSLMMFKR